jgi:hypothetical protein
MKKNKKNNYLCCLDCIFKFFSNEENLMKEDIELKNFISKDGEETFEEEVIINEKQKINIDKEYDEFIDFTKNSEKTVQKKDENKTEKIEPKKDEKENTEKIVQKKDENNTEKIELNNEKEINLEIEKKKEEEKNFIENEHKNKEEKKKNIKNLKIEEYNQTENEPKTVITDNSDFNFEKIESDEENFSDEVNSDDDQFQEFHSIRVENLNE